MISPRAIISYSNVGGRLGRAPARPSRRPKVSCEHTTLWRITASRQGFNVLFSFIHEGRSFDLFQQGQAGQHAHGSLVTLQPEGRNKNYKTLLTGQNW